MFLGCVIFPAGWDNDTIKGICGAEAGKYKLGNCEIRWAYILAIIGIIDCLFLAILAFVLACTQPKSLKKYIGANGIVRCKYMRMSSLTKHAWLHWIVMKGCNLFDVV